MDEGPGSLANQHLYMTNSMWIRAGFTLIDLMIVVVIIGILAAVAIPKFQSVTRGSKEAEAQPLLKQIYTLEERYRAKEGSYTMDLTQLEGGATLANSGTYFGYAVATHATGFCAIASPNTKGSAAGLNPQSLVAAGAFHETGDCS
jgi:type IV pilus assembly protein PilE